jgi:hypothetical protein
VITDIEQACDRLLALGQGTPLLDVSIAEAIAAHRVVDAAEVTGPEGRDRLARTGGAIVGIFPGPAAERLALVRGDDTVGGRPATLEEVVLGHLAAGRKPRPAALAGGLAA